MMVNCPKCSLLQPKDQYCARCGINMETWQPPPQPLWKKIITNWMVQLAVLFTLIFFIVLRDNLKSGGPQEEAATPIMAEQNFYQSREQSFQQASAPPTQTDQPSSRLQKVAAKGMSAAKDPVQETEEDTRLLKRANLRVFLMSRSLIEKLAQNSQRLSGSSLIIPRIILNKTLTESRTEFQAIGSFSNNFEMEQPILFFVGEEDLETGLNLGFFMQFNVGADSTKDRIQVEARHWSQLQLSGELNPQSVTAATLSHQSSLIVLDIGAHDADFSPEERSLFEASPKLRSLNENSFSEGLSEIALVLTIE